MISNNSKAYILTISAVLIWSTIPAAFKIIAASLSPAQILFFGMGPAALAFLGYILFRGELRALLHMGAVRWGVSMLLGAWLYLFYTLVFTAYEYLSPQIIMPINNTWSLLMAFLSPFLLRQRISWAEVFWMLFAYCGGLLSVFGAESLGPINLTGLACICVCPFMYAVYWTVNARSGIPQHFSFLAGFFMAFILAALVMLVRGEEFLLTGRQLTGGLYVALFELAIPYMLLGISFRLTDSVSRLATFQLAIPFLALIWIALILHEEIVWTTPAGILLIVIGIVQQQRAAVRRTRLLNAA
ncbi:MAG: DMT family transporter [Mailhella sp.]|nr:DMT family transporter [Mailhella sp.]